MLLVVARFLSLSVHAAPLADWLSTTKADAAIAEQDWAAAEDELERIIGGLRNRAYRASDLGPIFFKKGWSELKQQKWNEAMKSFETCYKLFPSSKNDKNPFHAESLHRWGDAAAGAKDFQTASRLYKRFIEESLSTK